MPSREKTVFRLVVDDFSRAAPCPKGNKVGSSESRNAPARSSQCTESAGFSLVLSGMRFALSGCLLEQATVNLTQLLGVIALSIGIGLLSSELVLGQAVLVEETGTSLLLLQWSCTVVIVLDAFALLVGTRKMQEINDRGKGPRG